jgi:hypothetical protein
MRSFLWECIFAIERLWENANFGESSLGMRSGVDTVLRREEHGSCREHDSGIVEDPGMVKRDEVVDGLLKEGMALFSKHEVVGDTDGDGLGKNHGILEQGVHGAETADVEVYVDAAIVV